MDLTHSTHLTSLRSTIMDACAALRAYNQAADILNTLCAPTRSCYRVNHRHRGGNTIELKTYSDVVSAVICRWRNAVVWDASEAFAEGTGAMLSIDALPWLGLDYHPHQEREYWLKNAVRKALAALDGDDRATDLSGCVDALLAVIPVAHFLDGVQAAGAQLRDAGLRALAARLNCTLWLASPESRRRLKLRGKRYELTISSGQSATPLDELASLGNALKAIAPHCGHRFAVTGFIDDVLQQRPAARETVRLGDMAVRVYQAHLVVVLPPADADVIVAFVASHLPDVAEAVNYPTLKGGA